MKSITFRTEPGDRQLAAAGTGCMRLTLSLDGILELSRLRRAVEQVLDAVPILKCRFDDQRWRPRWNAAVGVGADDVLLVRSAGESPTAAGWEHTAGAFRIEVSRGVTDQVVVWLDHALGDFRALMKCVQLLADTYVALERDPSYRLGVFPPFERGFRAFARRLPWSERRQILSSGFRVLGEWSRCGKWRVSRAEPDAAAASRHYVRQELGAEAVARLESYGVRRRVTVYHLLVAAYFLALTAVLPDSDACLAIGAPIDLRRRFGTPASFDVANLCGVEPIMLRRSADAALESTAEAVREQLTGARRSILGTAGSPLFTACLPPPLPWLGELLPFEVLRRWNRRQRAAANRGRELRSVMASIGEHIDSERTRFGTVRIRDAEAELLPLDVVGCLALHVLAFDDRRSLWIGWGTLEEMSAIRDGLMRVLEPALGR